MTRLKQGLLAKAIRSRRGWYGATTSILFSVMVWLVAYWYWEAHDHQAKIGFYRVIYPLLGIGSILAGAIFRAQPWRWGVLIMATQFTILMITSQSYRNLWPIELLIYSVLAIPTVAASYFGAWLGNRWHRSKGGDSA